MKHALLGTGSAQKELAEQQCAPECSRVVVQQGATGSSRVCSCVRSADTRPHAVQGGQGGAGKGTHDTRRVDFCQRVLRPPPLSPYPAALPSPSARPPVPKKDKHMLARPLLRAQCLAHWHFLDRLSLVGSRDLEHATLCARDRLQHARPSRTHTRATLFPHTHSPAGTRSILSLTHEHRCPHTHSPATCLRAARTLVQEYKTCG